jgi:hypothetical protein
MWAEGGKVLLCGADNTQLFAPPLNLQIAAPAAHKTYFAAGDIGFAAIEGNWIDLHAESPDIVAKAYPEQDLRNDALPVGVLVKHGKGMFTICPGPITSAYAIARTPVIRSLMVRLASSLHQPMISIDADLPELEIIMRENGGRFLIHLVNVAGAPVTGEFRHTGYVPRTGPFKISVRLSKAPGNVFFEPEHLRMKGEYRSGVWQGTVPDLHIHGIVALEGMGQ